jgi:hypothetical protein
MTLRYSQLAPNYLSNAVTVLNGTMNPISTILAQSAKEKAPSFLPSA